MQHKMPWNNTLIDITKAYFHMDQMRKQMDGSLQQHANTLQQPLTADKTRH